MILEKLFKENEIAEEWNEWYEKFLEFYHSELMWIFDQKKIEEICEIYEIENNYKHMLIKTIELVKNNKELKELMEFWYFMLFPETNIKKLNIKPIEPLKLIIPHIIPDTLKEMFPVVVSLSHTWRLQEYYLRKNIPSEVIKKTRKDILLHFNQYYKINGRPGMGVFYMNWLRCYFEGRLYWIGRLQYEIRNFNKSYILLKNKKNNIVKCMLDDNIEVRRDGFINGTNQLFDKESKNLQFTDEGEYWSGYTFNDKGIIIFKEKVMLLKSEWELMVIKHNPVVFIHIPEDGKLDINNCRQSLFEASNFFEKYFPESKLNAFFCFSWLLDPLLQLILDKESNIVKFQSLFSLISAKTNGDSIFMFLFRCKDCEIDELPENTFLQKKVKEFLRCGGKFREFGGFIPFPYKE